MVELYRVLQLKYVLAVLRVLTLLASLGVAYNFCMALLSIYRLDWYALYFENDTIGLFMGSFFWFQAFFLLRFFKIRPILITLGMLGILVMLAKLQYQPFTLTHYRTASSNMWPDRHDIEGIVFFSAILLVEGLLANYIARGIDFLSVRPLKRGVSYVYGRLRA